MAGVAGEQDLVGGRARQEAARRSSGSRARASSRCTTSYSPSGSLLESLWREAEAPVLAVVGRAVRDPVGLVGQRVKMRPQLRERHARAHGHAVVDDVQVGAPEVDDALARARSATQASRMFHSCGTVQSRTCVPVGTSWIVERASALRAAGASARRPVARDAAADRVELRDAARASRGRAPRSRRGPATPPTSAVAGHRPKVRIGPVALGDDAHGARARRSRRPGRPSARRARARGCRRSDIW